VNATLLKVTDKVTAGAEREGVIFDVVVYLYVLNLVLSLRLPLIWAGLAWPGLVRWGLV